MKIASIVEGHGEVAALPILLRRLHTWLTPENYPLEIITPPIRVHRDRFLNKPEEFRRMLLLAADKCSPEGWVLVLLDADDDCPAGLAATITAAAQTIIPNRKFSVVLANREYEAWFIAAAESLNGQRGFVYDGDKKSAAESVRDAKKWLAVRRPGKSYHEVSDQPALTSLMDLQQAKENSHSFLKLCSEWQKHMSVN